MKLNELNLNQVVGDYGAAALKQVGNRITGKAEGNLSVQDKIAKDKFISDFIGRASTNLNSAIQSGLVDPKAKAAPPSTTPPGQTPAVAGAPKPVAAPGQKPAVAGAPKPVAAPGAPKTPEQIRKEKQAAAGQVAQQQMGTLRSPAQPAPAGQAPAQQQPGMTQDGRPQWDPATGKGAKYDGVTGQTTPAYQAELDKQKAAGEEQAKARLAATQSAQQATASPTAPAASTPSTATGVSGLQFGQAALDKMKQKNPKLAGMMAQAGMDADGNDKMTPQQTAALKGRLKAGAAATSGQSGFKNYVGGSGERMTGVDKSGAPVFQKIQREGTYSKLDYILESIININEAPAAQTISQYLQNMFNQYVKVTDPAVKTQVKKLADMAQASYPKMTNALTQLANLGFASNNSQGSGETQGVGDTTSQPQSAASSFMSGLTGAGTTTPASASGTTTPATQGGSPYDQVVALVSKLSKEEKQQLLTSLTKPEAAPASNAGAGAFGQMSKQLQKPKTTANPIDTRQQKLNTNKVKPGNKGSPTPDEQAKLQQRIQQQLAAQA